MAKIAICFAGLPRLIPETKNTWKRFIDLYDADVFVHTWSSTIDDRYSISKNITEILNPKLMIIEDLRIFNIARFNERIWPHRSQPNNVLSMWYSIREAIKLCKRYSQQKNIVYDTVCRARFDWWCPNLELIESTGLTIPDDLGLSGHHFTYQGRPYIGHNDQFGYGTLNVMDLYASTFDRIPWLYSDDGVDFCSELFLTANMISAGIPITYQKNLTYKILR